MMMAFFVVCTADIFTKKVYFEVCLVRNQSYSACSILYQLCSSSVEKKNERIYVGEHLSIKTFFT